MPIPNNLKTPDVYFDVNTNTQRTGLPVNNHRVLFITDDAQISEIGLPVDIYDKAQADQMFGVNSITGRMITAAIKTNRVVDVQALGKSKNTLPCTPTQIEIEDKGMDLPSNSFVTLTYSLSIPSKNIDVVNKTILVSAAENGTAPVFQEAIRQILGNSVQIIEGGGGTGHFQHYRTWIHGGDGSGILSDIGEVTITLNNSPNASLDLMNYLQMYGETQYFSQIAPITIHSCGSQYFAGL